MRAATAVCAMALVVAVAVTAAVLAGPRLWSDTAEIAVPATSAPVVANASTTQGDSVASLLRDPGRQVNISVVGDGTGRTLGAWLFGLAQDIGITYRRTVQIRDWRPGQPQSYSAPRTVITAAGRPVTIWNASTSRNVQYFIDTVQQWIPPIDPALVIVSNGAQEAPRAVAVRTIGLLDAIGRRLPGVTAVTIVQPNPPDRRPQYPNDDDPSRDLRTSLNLNGLPYIDVARGLESAGATGVYGTGPELMSAAGYREWARIVAQALPLLPVRSRP